VFAKGKGEKRKGLLEKINTLHSGLLGDERESAGQWENRVPFAGYWSLPFPLPLGS